MHVAWARAGACEHLLPRPPKMSVKLPFKFNIANGVPVPPNIDQQRLDKLKDFPLRPDDIFIVTFPKSGTNWTRQIVRLVLNNGGDDGRGLEDPGIIPWLTAMGRHSSFTEAMPSPRAFFAHMSYDTMHGGPPNTSPAKYIYVARNPKDALVSMYYHFISGGKYLGFSGQWDDLFEVFMNGRMYFGSWFDHVLGWWEHKDNPNILFLKYEDMKKDLPGAVRTIAKFIDVDLKPNVIEKIAEQSTIDSMKASPTTNFSNMPRFAVDIVNPFVRKGLVGGWKSHFTPEQSARLDALYEEKMKGTGLKFEFGNLISSVL